MDVIHGRTAPAITALITVGTLGVNGWYTGPVTAHFVCADPAAANGASSGLVPTACPDDVTLTANSAGQSVTGR
jgi:hypothetical protein